MSLSKRESPLLGVCLVLALLTTKSGAQAAGVVLTNLVRSSNGGVQLQASGAGGMICALQKTGNLKDWRTLDFTNVGAGDATFHASWLLA